MRAIFLGLSAANLIFLSAVFVLGLLPDRDVSAAVGGNHVAMAIFSGMLAVLVHMITFTYFMATTSWLAAATEKQSLNRARFVRDAGGQKRRVFLMCMIAVGATMLAMFSGAGADTTLNPGWASTVHFAAAAVALLANGLCAAGQYQQIRARGRMMDEALSILNGPVLGGRQDRPVPAGRFAHTDAEPQSVRHTT